MSISSYVVVTRDDEGKVDEFTEYCAEAGAIRPRALHMIELMVRRGAWTPRRIIQIKGR